MSDFTHEWFGPEDMFLRIVDNRPDDGMSHDIVIHAEQLSDFFYYVEGMIRNGG